MRKLVRLRNLLALCCILSFALHAGATEKLSIAQLKQRLAAAHSKSDRQLANLLAELELTERLSTPRLEKLTAALPGERSRMALLAIADASAFVPPPAEEASFDAPPDAKSQGEILVRAVEFVAKETDSFPNFVATRTTTRFQDTKNVPNANIPEYFTPGVFHFLDRKNAQVSYVGWMEADEEQHWGGPHAPTRSWMQEDPISAATFRPSRMGLSIRGLFGPMLVGVTRDILESKVGWSRWEESPAGRVAVFRFAVDKEGSTYYVKWCCYQRPQGGMNEFEAVPPYSGEIAIEPSTGKVVRLAIVGEFDSSAPISKAAIALEYGTVGIAGKSYFLPIRGVSMSVGRYDHVTSNTMANGEVFKNIDKFIVTAVNDLRFTDYKVYRGDLRIVSEPMENPPAQ